MPVHVLLGAAGQVHAQPHLDLVPGDVDVDHLGAQAHHRREPALAGHGQRADARERQALVDEGLAEVLFPARQRHRGLFHVAAPAQAGHLLVDQRGRAHVQPFLQLLRGRAGGVAAVGQAAGQFLEQRCQVQRLVEVVGQQFELQHLGVQVALLGLGEEARDDQVEHLLADQRVGLLALRQQLRVDPLVALAGLAVLDQVVEVVAAHQRHQQRDHGHADGLDPLQPPGVGVGRLARRGGVGAGHHFTRARPWSNTKSKRKGLSDR
ncbi:MAG: hypothetical protein U1F53_00565 [Burkholderiaceae bacterium]